MLPSFWCWITSLTHSPRGRPHLRCYKRPSPLPFLGLWPHCGRCQRRLCCSAGISLPRLGTENRATTAHSMAQPSSQTSAPSPGLGPGLHHPQLQARPRASSFQVLLRKAGAVHHCVPSWLEPSAEEERQGRSFFPPAKMPGGFFQQH